MPRQRSSTERIGEPQGGQRREASLSAMVTAGKRRVSFKINELSTTGARLVGPLPLAEGDGLTVTLTLGDDSIDVIAEVVRVQTADLLSDEVAVQFLALSRDGAAALEALVQRSAVASPVEIEDDRVTVPLPLPKRLAEVDTDAATIRYAKKLPHG